MSVLSRASSPPSQRSPFSSPFSSPPSSPSSPPPPPPRAVISNNTHAPSTNPTCRPRHLPRDAAPRAKASFSTRRRNSRNASGHRSCRHTRTVAVFAAHRAMHFRSGPTSATLKTTSAARMTSNGPEASTAARCDASVQSRGGHRARVPGTTDAPRTVRGTRRRPRGVPGERPPSASPALVAFRSTFRREEGQGVRVVREEDLAAPARRGEPREARTRRRARGRALAAEARRGRARAAARRRYCARQKALSQTMPPQLLCRVWSCSSTSAGRGARLHRRRRDVVPNERRVGEVEEPLSDLLVLAGDRVHHGAVAQRRVRVVAAVANGHGPASLARAPRRGGGGGGSRFPDGRESR